MKTINASTALALILGLGVGVAALPASAQQTPEAKPMACDTDDDGFVSVDEANVCAEDEFGGMAADEDYLTEEQFGSMYQGSAQFAEIDEDGDGQISVEEWVSWRERGFAEVTQGSDEMATSDFERWRGGDLPGTQSPAERSPSGGDSGSGGQGGAGSGGGQGGGSGSSN